MRDNRIGGSLPPLPSSLSPLLIAPPRMLIKQCHFQTTTGWNAALPRELDSAKTLVVVFAAPALGEASSALDDVMAAFPTSHLIGCSTAGEILGDAVHDDSMVVAVCRFERDTALRSAFAPLETETQSFEAGQALVHALAEPGLRAVFLISNGINVNGTELVRGLQSGVSRDVAIIGGLAADAARFQKTWVVSRSGMSTQGAAAIGLYGDSVRISYGSAGGWQAFGIERRITRSSGNVLYELDGRPALALYKEYLGARAADLPGSALLFPLALRAGPDDKNPIVRTVLSVDEATQSMRFAGDMPQSALAALMRTTTDQLVGGAERAANAARGGSAAEAPGLAIAVSCVGRRLVLGLRSDEEVDASLHALPAGSTQIGFYSYGEISPTDGGFCDLHNQTMTISYLREV